MRRSYTHLYTLLAAATLTGAARDLTAEPTLFRRGDANADGVVDISDAIATLHHLFTGGAQVSCADAADANDDGRMDLSDSVYDLLHLFSGGPAPPAPGSRCGEDPSADDLDCASHGPCEGADLIPLRRAESCEEVAAALRDGVAVSMERILAQNLEIALGGGSRCWLEDWLGPAAGPGGAGEEAASEYSETNNQVDGVDEADFVKTDGAFIYVAANGRFQVLDAWPAPETRVIASVPIEGEPKRLFVHGDRAVVYSSLADIYRTPEYPWLPVTGGECTYGYDCEFTGDGKTLEISVFDISDRSQPRLLREIAFNGSYVNARRVGDIVHTVVVFPEAAVPGLSYWPEELGSWMCQPPTRPEEEIRALFDALRERNLELIRDAEIADFLPSVKDTRHDGETPVVREDLFEDCTTFYLPGLGDGQSLVSLISFLIGGLDDLGSRTIVGKPGAVYASRGNLFLATRHGQEQRSRWFWEGPEPIPEATTIHKFQLFYDRSESSYLGSGVVKGRVLNQFAMDEHDGHLRIATTTGHLPSPDVHSTVSVLAQEESGLTLIGQVDGIAPSEDIRSVRFSGDLGFIVTFKKTDPLFVLDLSVPQSPEIRGELKIPGFSTYMHMLDETHVLSIGYDADDQGSFAWFTGILLQVFDVSDPENPVLSHREVIGSRGSTSDAATNHLAFTYFRPRGLLGLPITICEGGSGGTHGQNMTFSGLRVYRVDVDAGFDLLGGVPHAAPSPTFTCANWWTRSNSVVKRSIFMEDFVYSVALDGLDVSHVNDLENPVVRVTLGTSP